MRVPNAELLRGRGFEVPREGPIHTEAAFVFLMCLLASLVVCSCVLAIFHLRKQQKALELDVAEPKVKIVVTSVDSYSTAIE